MRGDGPDAVARRRVRRVPCDRHRSAGAAAARPRRPRARPVHGRPGDGLPVRRLPRVTARVRSHVRRPGPEACRRCRARRGYRRRRALPRLARFPRQALDLGRRAPGWPCRSRRGGELHHHRCDHLGPGARRHAERRQGHRLDRNRDVRGLRRRRAPRHGALRGFAASRLSPAQRPSRHSPQCF